MAITYCDGGLSNFKSDTGYAIDEFVKMFEISPTDVANIQTWKQLKASGNTESEEFKTLTEQLSSKIVTADAWNKLCDCMINLEKMYVDKGLDAIENTVEDYITNEETLNEKIDEQVGTTINNLLLTNATQVIISESQPAVVEGALWIKPKTT